jgi:hypothetical protein
MPCQNFGTHCGCFPLPSVRKRSVAGCVPVCSTDSTVADVPTAARRDWIVPAVAVSGVLLCLLCTIAVIYAIRRYRQSVTSNISVVEPPSSSRVPPLIDATSSYASISSVVPLAGAGEQSHYVALRADEV